MRMISLLAAGTALCLLPAWAVLAQQSPSPEPTPQQNATRAAPANICQELVAFLQPKPAPAAPAGAAPAAAPPQAPASSAVAPPASAQQPATQGGSAQQLSGQGGVAVEAPKPAAPAQQSAGQGTPAPQASGQSAPQTSGQSAPVPQGSGQNAPQTSGQSAPIPQGSAQSTPAQTAVTLEQAQALAGANDIKACRDAAQQMRRAGVALPPALIALAALDLKYHQAEAPR